MDIDHRARPGPIRIKRRRCQLKRPVGALLGRGICSVWISSLGALPVRHDLLIGRLSLLLSVLVGDLDGPVDIAVFRVAGRIGGFGGSVPVVVLVLTPQVEAMGGLGEDADGFGSGAPRRGRCRLAGPRCRRSGRWWP